MTTPRIRLDPARIRAWPQRRQYALAITLVLLALGVRWVLDPLLGEGAIWIAVFSALLFLAMFVRTGPLLLASAVSFVGVSFLFLEPLGAFAVGTRMGQVHAAMFLVGTSIAIYASWHAGRTLLREERAEARYRTLVRAATLGVVEADPGTRRLLSVNPAFCALTGYGEAELLAMSVDALSHPDDRDADRALYERLRRGESADYRTQKRYLRKDGSVVWVSVSGSLIRDAAGRPLRAFAVVEDVTSRKRAEDALRESQERMQIALGAARGGTWDMDLASGRIEWSDDAFRVLGHAPRPDGFAHESLWRDTVVPEDVAAIDAEWRRAERERDVFRTELRARRADDGRPVWIRLAGRFLHDEDGRALRFTGIWLDVTEERQADEEVRRANERLGQALHELRSTWSQSPVGMAQLDRGLRYVRVNDTLAAINGVPAAEHLGRTLGEVLPGIAPRIEPHLRRVLETGEPARDVELVSEAPSEAGVPRIWRGSWYPMRGANGEVTGVNVVVQDVTERERAERALRASEARFRAMADSTPALIWTADAGGAIDFHNRRWSEYTGLERAESAARFWSVLHPEDRDACLGSWEHALATGSEFEIEVRIRRADGGHRWFLTRATPLRDADGRVAGWYGSSTDIHESKQAEQALREADRKKDEFLAMLAHELRNPLAPLQSGLQVLRLNGGDAGTARRVRAVMERQIAHMVRLVDDLMEVSRITRGKIELQRQPVELAAVVESAVETSRPLLEAGGHGLEVRLPRERVVLDGDPVRLAQVLTNLLNNAAKFTEPGGQVWLAAWREGFDVVISVRDTGLGIPAELLPAVFDLFSQADRSRGRAHGGLGIGLTLVRALVELHGGRVEARSEGPGKGSEFVVRLPLPRAERASAVRRRTEPPRVPAAAPRRILVVDDNHDAADSLAMLVSLRGAEVTVAHDGAGALEAFARERPGLVLLDIGMPGMDGYEVARRMRERPEGQNVTLVALTGWGQPEDRRRSAAAGFDDHLVKPVDLEVLDALLAARARA